jgi:DNA-binding MarR family transcriptional regulator
VDRETVLRFRRAFWHAFRELDTVRLRQWESSKITLPQLRVLYQLRRQPRSTTGELSRALGITVSTASGLVIKLVDRGLVERFSAVDDRRQAPLAITELGMETLSELTGTGRAFLDGVAERLGDRLPMIIDALEEVAEATLLEQLATQEASTEKFTVSAGKPR